MISFKKEFGVVGLGRMGGNLALQALEKGMRVAGYVRRKVREDLVKAGIVTAKDLGAFVKELTPPRAVFVYIPAGPPVDTVLDDLAATLEKGDILVDGGNSYWGVELPSLDFQVPELFHGFYQPGS